MTDPASIYFFRNHFLSGNHTRSQLEEFWDIAITRKFALRFNPGSLMEEISRALSATGKSARFYTPILINIVRNLGYFLDWKGRPDEYVVEQEANGKQNLESQVRHLFKLMGEEDYCRMIQAMPAGVLVYLTCLDRYYISLSQKESDQVKLKKKNSKTTKNEPADKGESPPNFIDLDRTFDETIGDWIFESKWIEARISLNAKDGLPPTSILSPPSRGKVRKAIAEKLAERKRKRNAKNKQTKADQANQQSA